MKQPLNQYPLNNIPPLFLIALSLIFCTLLYWPGLNGPLLLDDMANLSSLFKTNISLSEAFSSIFSKSGPLGRPVSMLSFIFNAVSSQDIFYWKLTSFVIHLSCAVLIYKLVRQITQQLLLEETASDRKFFAVTIAIIWLIHPLHISTVFYVVQRMTLLATFFSLASMLSYIIARQQPKNSLFYQFLAWLVFFPLAVLSKETAFLIPAFILLLELFIVNKTINNKVFTAIFTAIIVLSIAFFVYKTQWILNGYRLRDFSFSERILTQPRVISSYIGMILLPVQKSMGFMHDGFSLSSTLFKPFSTFTSILFIACLIFIAFFVRKKSPLISFGILFYFTGHILESSIFALEIMFEHRNHLPSLGLIIAGTEAINLALQSKQAKFLFFSLIFILYSFITWQRAQTWSNINELFFYMERVHPESERLASALANQAMNAGLYPLARTRLKNFNSLGSKIQVNYIKCLENKNLADQHLLLTINKSSIVNNYVTMGLIDLANLGLDKQCGFSDNLYLKLLDDVFKNALISNNNRQMLMMYKAHFLWQQDNKEQAINTLKQNFILNKKNPTPLFLACEWAIDSNFKNEIEETCQKALTVSRKIPIKFDELALNIEHKLNKYKMTQKNNLP